MLDRLRKDIQKQSSPQKAKANAWFFKTGKGEYGEGDMFVGLTVPQMRKLVLQYRSLSLSEIEDLLRSKIHEERLIALFILVQNFNIGNEKTQKTIYDFYLSHTKFINNWDLVDSSAHKIVGEYLISRPRAILYTLAKSDSLWERRISIIATAAFISSGDPKDTLKISKLLLNDKHDLIHKAVGWMLREVGKRCSREILQEFLKRHYQVMPRTMLRYSIEHFSKDIQTKYLKGLI